LIVFFLLKEKKIISKQQKNKNKKIKIFSQKREFLFCVLDFLMTPFTDFFFFFQITPNNCLTFIIIIERTPQEIKQFTENVSLSDFEITKTLGTGSFGRVLHAKHKESGHFVAIKVLNKLKVIKTKQIDHVKYEKTLLNLVNSPFVVNILAHFQDSKNLYLVLEYVQGGEMFYHLRKAGRF